MVPSSEPHIVSAPNEYKLSFPPSDTISRVRFGPESSKFLLVSSWDSSVRLYDVSSNSQRLTYSHVNAVLDCAFHDIVRCVSGGLDKLVKLYDINHGTETILGRHDEAVKCVEYSHEIGVVFSGGWDSKVRLWDSRAATKCMGVYDQTEKVYTMTCSGHRMIVGTAGRKILVWDLRNMGPGPEQQRESSLKYQTRCIRAFPSKDGFVQSSIEGRVAVEYLDLDPEIQKRKYAFKCHRVKEPNGQELIYPVNAISFHPIHNTFATGGSDGLVNIWDPFNKKRLCQFHKYPTSISTLSFSADGSCIAIGSSYLNEFAQDPSPLPENCIFIRKVTDQETKPKS